LLPQVPPQHCESLVQACPSETHAVEPHVVPLQCKSQQSVATVQPAPGAPHAVIDDSQVFVTGLHVCEQHSAPPVHKSPNALQLGPEPAALEPALAPLPVVPPVAAPPSPMPALPPLFELAPVPLLALPPLFALPPEFLVVVPPLPPVWPFAPARSPEPAVSPAPPPVATLPPAPFAELPPVPSLPLLPPTPTLPPRPLLPCTVACDPSPEPQADATPSETMPTAKSPLKRICVSDHSMVELVGGPSDGRL
jgi:hypothetical protein